MRLFEWQHSEFLIVFKLECGEAGCKEGSKKVSQIIEKKDCSVDSDSVKPKKN